MPDLEEGASGPRHCTSDMAHQSFPGQSDQENGVTNETYQAVEPGEEGSEIEMFQGTVDPVCYLCDLFHLGMDECADPVGETQENGGDDLQPLGKRFEHSGKTPTNGTNEFLEVPDKGGCHPPDRLEHLSSESPQIPDQLCEHLLDMPEHGQERKDHHAGEFLDVTQFHEYLLQADFMPCVSKDIYVFCCVTVYPLCLIHPGGDGME